MVNVDKLQKVDLDPILLVKHPPFFGSIDVEIPYIYHGFCGGLFSTRGMGVLYIDTDVSLTLFSKFTLG